MKIKELIIFTSQIVEQRHFYEIILGLKTTEVSENSISFKIGKSVLTFQKRENSKPYHFAMNIPSNQVNAALSWLKERVEVQKDQANEIIDFPAWNANSLYFYDPDKNIVEFIARQNLNNKSATSFNSESILEISEIGLATKDFKMNFELLTIKAGLKPFWEGTDIFGAVGTETGLIILVDKNQKKWFPTNDKACASDFILRIVLDGVEKTIEYHDENLSTN